MFVLRFLCRYRVLWDNSPIALLIYSFPLLLFFFRKSIHITKNTFRNGEERRARKFGRKDDARSRFRRENKLWSYRESMKGRFMYNWGVYGALRRHASWNIQNLGFTLDSFHVRYFRSVWRMEIPNMSLNVDDCGNWSRRRFSK